jgi:hypothetical protein
LTENIFKKLFWPKKSVEITKKYPTNPPLHFPLLKSLQGAALITNFS